MLTNLRLYAQQLRLEQVQLGLDRREVGEVALQRLLHLVMLEQNIRGQRQSTHTLLILSTRPKRVAAVSIATIHVPIKCRVLGKRCEVHQGHGLIVLHQALHRLVVPGHLRGQPQDLLLEGPDFLLLCAG